ncbi:helix-turn-helix transcriptional regulator [Flavobacteriaceae bacterium]|jgi:DNA-binding HxlR family transcriptional regulator|nr:helix-turn-helix transcriptional regulator [Flavobacteriaceae bacterium]MDA8949020.1 helix-turn-helix transcriptional regulator [Flavobacteriaceae bacterium]MDA9326455.1 helix-turn-helix transcriptional regulator [Flavobacteriaceae bacterium]MDA9812165.1 helix-turn-helix transcriptional regulator [Flavobacteriaceae bacterium]MDB3985278.1 helix-turn-helix transcriptional regulator [Flavobacteriaceae bacterium]
MSFLDKIFRCDCPVTSALDVVGDKWTLVIIKLMLLEYKKTFKDFYESDESIAPNILSARLKTLLKTGFITKVNHPDNKKTFIYNLTEKGLSLTPVITELAVWSHNNVRESDIYMLNMNIKNKSKLNQQIINKYKEIVL